MRSLSPTGLPPFVSRTLKSFLILGSLAGMASFAQVQIAPSALKQVEEVYAYKASLTPAEQKMSTQLVLASRVAAGKSLGALARFYAAPKKDAQSRVEVDILGYASPSLLAAVAANGTATDHPSATYQHTHIHGMVHAGKLAELASHSDVTSLRVPSQRHTNAGSITSQGYVAMNANKVVSTGVTGANVKVGVLSDSASAARVSALIASGDLPANTVVLPGQDGPTSAQGGTDEGTAMMEIVHDMAPSAQIFFATAFTSDVSFAANIRTLRFTYGCDIIVDDVSYSGEPVFQDGIIAQAVNDVTAAGALYFSSAANSGNLTSGTSGTWEGDFSPLGTTTTSKGTVAFNKFGTVNTDTLTTASNDIVLQWSDPLGASGNDYDLFVFNSTGTTMKAFSTDSQTGTQDPIEEVYSTAYGGTYTPAAGDLIAVTLVSGGATRALHIDTERATLSVGTTGATFGHNAGASTFSAAAVYWNAGHLGAKPFNSSNPNEAFSSDGPRKIFYNPNGTAITPGNFLFSTSGGTTLIKPDAAGADGVSTATPGFLPFFGTSAAAPHEAGVAALVKSANPALTNTQIRNIMTSTAIDNMAPGVDRDSGYGIVNAAAAVAAAKALITTK